jgi:hypothetical protein
MQPETELVILWSWEEVAPRIMDGSGAPNHLMNLTSCLLLPLSCPQKGLRAGGRRSLWIQVEAFATSATNETIPGTERACDGSNSPSFEVFLWMLESKCSFPRWKYWWVKCSTIWVPGATLPLGSVLRWKPYLHGHVPDGQQSPNTQYTSPFRRCGFPTFQPDTNNRTSVRNCALCPAIGANRSANQNSCKPAKMT